MTLYQLRHHEKCCNGTPATSIFFKNQKEILDHYMYNSSAITDQFKYKRYASRNNGECIVITDQKNNISDVRLYKEATPHHPHNEIVFDKDLYGIHQIRKHEVGDIVVYENKSKMTATSILSAECPMYTIEDTDGKSKVVDIREHPLLHPSQCHQDTSYRITNITPTMIIVLLTFMMMQCMMTVPRFSSRPGYSTQIIPPMELRTKMEDVSSLQTTVFIILHLPTLPIS